MWTSEVFCLFFYFWLQSFAFLAVLLFDIWKGELPGITI